MTAVKTVFPNLDQTDANPLTDCSDCVNFVHGRRCERRATENGHSALTIPGSSSQAPAMQSMPKPHADGPTPVPPAPVHADAISVLADAFSV